MRQSVGDVHEEVYPLFEKIAAEMIADMGATKALCAGICKPYTLNPKPYAVNPTP